MITQNTNINIRLSQELKDDFIKATKDNGVNYSKLLRNFMRDYIKNSRNEEDE